MMLRGGSSTQDGTLVQFKDPTATFSMNANDWKLFNPEVPKVLEEYYDKGYKIVVFRHALIFANDSTRA